MRTNDLEKRLALATVEYEEMELHIVKYLKDISKLEDDIKNFIKTENRLIKKNDELKSNVDDLTTDIEELEEKNKTLDSEKNELNDRVDELCRELHGRKVISDNQIYALENKVSKTQKDLKEATDNALIYEHTLKNKELEINLLNSKLSSVSNCENCEKNASVVKDIKAHMDPNHSEEDVPSTSKCGTCEYESDDEKDMRKYIFATHVDVPSIFNCGTCTYTSDCEIDLQIHIDSSHTLSVTFVVSSPKARTV